MIQFAGSREAGASYAATLPDGTARLDRAGVCGWIVDLRGNSGGNVWPMLDGVARLLGEGHVLTFDVPAQGHFRVLIKGGAAYQEGGAVPVAAASAPLRNPAAPIALLTDAGTASSGEALAVAFAGRGGVRRFGQATAGYVTVNMPLDLPDGALIYMTVGWNRDRLGRRYDAALPPEEATPAAAAEARAARWLAAQPACRRRQ